MRSIHAPIVTIALTLTVCAGVVTAEMRSAASAAGPSSKLASVTITNITRGQTFTPIIVASHKSGVRLFELGEPASPELIALAEDGAIGPLGSLLASDPDVLDIKDSGGLLFPGDSVTVEVMMSDNFDHISLGAMLLPTNDGFISLNGVAGPGKGGTIMLRVPAYDAGSEMNDESCASIPGPSLPFPGPECGLGGSPGGGEGYVHIHAGIHGVGDLKADERDWRNPVARVTIDR